MFKVNGLKKTDCDANPKHADRDCFEVEDLMTGQHLAFCPKCFESQVALRCKGKKTETTATRANGQPAAHTVS